MIENIRNIENESLLFLCGKYTRVLGTALTPLVSLRLQEWESSVGLHQLSLLPQFGSASTILSPGLSVSWTISQVSVMWGVLLASLLWGAPHVCYSHFPNLDQWVHLQSQPPAAHVQAPSTVHIPPVSYVFSGSIYVWFRSHFQLGHCWFRYGKFILVGRYPLLITRFCKMSPSSIAGRQRGHLTTAFAVCARAELDVRVTDRLWKKWCGLSPITTPVIYDLWTEELAMKTALYVITGITEIWTAAWGTSVV